MPVKATIEELPSGRWRVRLREGRRYIGSETFSNSTLAREWANVRAGEVERRGAGLMHAARVPDTIGDLLGEYLAGYVSRLKSASSTAYRVAGLQKVFGALHYGELTPDRVAAWVAARSAQVSPESVRRELVVLGSFITWCRKTRRLPALPENPLDVDRPPQGRARDRRLVGDEAERLLHALGDHAGDVKGAKRSGAYRVGTRNPWMLPIVLLAIETAMRQGELLALRWEHVDLDAQTAYLPDTKNGETRTVPLSSRAVALLKALPRTDEARVFPITSEAVKLAWRRACKRAGIVDLHFHDLRHEAASRLAEKLPNLIELAAVTGHKDLRMLRRYYHPRATDLARKLG